ncbi:MAG: SsrA-binding protein [Thermodesulfobacteriota bacterium]|nr:SsrA-binding protein [Thermodesulfobacteriota bacterium]
MKQSDHTKLICKNKKAYFNFELGDTFEAGLVLLGSEVKSLRAGKANLGDSYAKFRRGELYLIDAHISPYTQANRENHDPLRERKLLLHKHELKRLFGKITEKGFSLVPLKLYLRGGKVKVELALARGKKTYDKREAIRKKDQRREMERLAKYRHRDH